VNYKKFLGTASAAVMIVIVVTLMLAPGAWASYKYKTLYKFKGGKDGKAPFAGLIFDAAGNLYGTTAEGGPNKSSGTVFQLTPGANGTWSETVLYSFCSASGCTDGATPLGGLVFDVDGNLYGTTQDGGNQGKGTVFQLTNGANGTWTEKVLYSFCSAAGCTDGANPMAGLIFDAVGNLYSTAQWGGAQGRGTVFQLTPSANGDWTETVLHSFGKDGYRPMAGLIFDAAGNLYSTTMEGAIHGGGTVFQLTPGANGAWTETVLHTFPSKRPYDGYDLWAGLIFDAAGNLYSTTFDGGAYAWYGTVFRLTPAANGTWKENVLHSFNQNGKDGCDAGAGLMLDATGNLYGVAMDCGSGYNTGVVFRLSPSANGKWWREKILHTFINNGKAGYHPTGVLVSDAAAIFTA
jgi:uncharacterized repeat protein (TIGR03803 family)